MAMTLMPLAAVPVPGLPGRAGRVSRDNTAYRCFLRAGGKPPAGAVLAGWFC